MIEACLSHCEMIFRFSLWPLATTSPSLPSLLSLQVPSRQAISSNATAEEPLPNRSHSASSESVAGSGHLQPMVRWSPQGALGFTSNSNLDRKKHTSNSMKKFIWPRIRATFSA